MSALQTSMDNNAVDPGHRLEELVRKVQPHLSHLVTMPHQELIVGHNDRLTEAICHPIDRVYVMTNKGLAYRVRPLFVLKTLPRLMSHVSISLIEERANVRITAALESLLEQQIRLYGLASVQSV